MVVCADAYPLPGNVTKDPAFGLPAIWIEGHLRDQAHVLGYTVVDAGTVVATHLNHVIMSHAAELLGRQETQHLLDHIAKDAPKLVEDLVPKQLPLATVQRVLQNLLEEGVTSATCAPSSNVLAEYSPRTQDPLELTTQVRIALGRAIVQQLYQGSGGAAGHGAGAGPRAPPGPGGAGRRRDASGIEPGLADTLLRETAAAAQRQEEVGLPAVLLVPGNLRWLLSRFLRRAWPTLRVLANAEVPESRTSR